MTAASRPRPVLVALAAGLDIVLIVVFAAAGRGSHARESTLEGLWQTSWPFLAGLAIGWLVLLVWRRPIAPLRSGLPLALITVLGGMLLRIASGQGTALPFVLVAVGSLTLLLVGWRLLGMLGLYVTRRR
ncbi:DUF3054 domain-containing protein [Leucobacter sp. GX24907]